MKTQPPYLPPHEVAALQNTDPKWFKIIEKCGIQIVAVHLFIKLSPPNLEHALDLALREAKLGYYDSSHYPGCLNSSNSGYVWHFLHTHDLGKAMACLKAELEKRGLLKAANILHAEAPYEFRIWFSYDSETIGQLVASNEA